MSHLSHELSGGSGPAVLFLHGFMGSAAEWREVAAALDDKYLCLFVDLPGHGGSVGLPYPDAYTMEGAARKLCDLLDESKIERAALVGYSMGGRLALYFALRYPERCGGLLLESASPGIASTGEQKTRRQTDEAKARLLESGDFGEFVRDWYRQPLFESLLRHEGLVDELVAKRRNNDQTELARSLREMGTGRQSSLWEELPNLAVPALAIAGALDEKFVRITHRMAKSSLQIQAAVVPGVGHNVRVEDPEAYLDLLDRFLDAT